MRRWRWWILGATAAVVAGLVAGWLALGPLAVEMARRAARERGMDLEAESATVVPGRVTLARVRLSTRDEPAVTVDIDRVVVGLSWWSPRNVRLERPSIVGRGDPRPTSKTRDAARKSRHPVPVRVVDGRVDWTAPGFGIERLRVEGLEASSVEAEVTATTVEIEHQRGTVRVDGVGARRAGRRLSSVVADRLQLTTRAPRSVRRPRAFVRRLLGAGSSAEPVASATAPPPSAVASAASATPPLGAAVDARPPVATAASAEADGPGAGGALFRRYLASAGKRADARLGELVAAEFDGTVKALQVRLEVEGSALNLGPFAASLSRRKDRIRLAVKQKASGDRDLHVAVTLPTSGQKPIVVEGRGGPLALSTIGVREGDLGLASVKNARLRVDGRVAIDPARSTLTMTGSVQVASLALEHRRLAARPLTGIDVRLAGEISAHENVRRVDVRKLEVTLGDVAVRLRGSIDASPGLPHVEAHVDVPLVACQAILEAAPRGLVPGLRGMRLSGTASLRGHLVLDTANPGKASLNWDGTNECRVAGVPPAVAPRRFSRTFSHNVRSAKGAWLRRTTGPGASNWTPLPAISRHLETAVLVCEDSHFHRHRGFDGEAVKNSILANLAAGRFVRGASTISMQLAKNLYVNREKTLSRKLQEAGFTMLLEQQLSKAEILELYFNVIEFGPGVYGIGAAARHYFHTTPAELSPGQALYLASILPNPRVQHFRADGRLSDHWARYLRKLMRTAHRIRRLTDDELADALDEEIRFGMPAPKATSDPERPMASAAPDEGDGTPLGGRRRTAPDGATSAPPPEGERRTP